MLRLQLLGDVDIRYGGSRLSALDAPRLQQLLAVLVLRRGVPLQRARLAFRLWPESSDRQALTNLRHLLHDLRHALPAPQRFLEVSPRTVAWRRDAPVDADVAQFMDAAERGEGAADPTAARAALAEAAAAYRGDLLPGCWDDATLEERDGLRRRAMTVMDRLAALAEEAGDLGAAVAAAERRLNLDPLDEPTYRLLMRLHLRQGSRTRALRVYHGCAAVLSRELGVEPDAETEALRATVSGSGSGPAEVAAMAEGQGLVGRVEEYAAAMAAWDRASAGEAYMLIVTGEAGIGKTHLLEELAGWAAGRGGVVVRSRCYEASGRLAWAPVADWLRAAELESALGRLDDVWAGELSLLFPALRRRAQGRVRPARDVDGNGRRRLFEAMARLLRELHRPTLLVIDDLQWCDGETLSFLDYLISHERDTPLMVAASLRWGDGPSNVARLTSDLTRRGVLREIPLERFDERTTAELAARLLGRRLDGRAAGRLFAESEGNPLFVVEALRAGLGGAGGPIWPTPTIRAVITNRLASLSPGARAVVEVAAVVGRSFSTEVLLRAAGMAEDALAEALDELWRRRVVREQGTGYDFSHDTIREVAYAAVSPARRRRLHRTVAGALRSLYGEAPGPESARLAEQYEKSGQIEEAIAALRQAAAYALSVFAADDAIETLERALRLLAQVPSIHRRDELELEIRVEMGAPVVGRHGYGAPETNRLYGRARSLSRRLGTALSPPVLRGLAIGAVANCRFDAARGFGEELLAHHDDAAVVVEGHYVLGVVSFWVGELETAESHLRRALERYRPEDVTRHLTRFAQDPRAVCLCRLGHTLWHRGQTASAMRLATEAVRVAEELNHPISHGYALVYAAWVAGEAGEVDAMRRWVEAGIERWTRQRLGFFRPATPLFVGWLRLLTGDESGLKLLRKGVAGWRREGRNLHFTHALSLLAGALLRRGDERGLEVVEEALAWTGARRQRYLEPELVRLRGELLIQAGRAADGAAELRKAAALASAMGARAFELRAALSLARHVGELSPLRALAAFLDGEGGGAEARAAAALLG